MEMILKNLLLWSVFTMCFIIGSTRAAQCGSSVSQCKDVHGKCTNVITTNTCAACMQNPKISISSIVVNQNGQNIDNLGGLNICDKLDIVLSGVNNHGIVANPMVEIRLYLCKSELLECHWRASIVNHLLPRFNPCRAATGVHMQDCHFKNNPVGVPSQFYISLDLKDNEHLKPYLNDPLFPKGLFYELEVILFDGSNQLLCADVTTFLKNIKC